MAQGMGLVRTSGGCISPCQMCYKTAQLRPQPPLLTGWCRKTIKKERQKDRNPMYKDHEDKKNSGGSTRYISPIYQPPRLTKCPRWPVTHMPSCYQHNATGVLWYNSLQGYSGRRAIEAVFPDFDFE